MTGYKTYIASALVALFGVLQATDWIETLSNPKAALPTLGIAIVMAILRTVTSTPPGKSS